MGVNSKALAVNQAELQEQRRSIDSIAALIQACRKAEDVRAIRAKVEGAKAWAKTYRLTKELRLEFLRFEILALVKLAELDASEDLLSASEAEAAARFAAMTGPELDSLLAQYGSATTAAGLYRSVTRDEEASRRFRRETDEWSQRWLNRSPRIPGSDDDIEERVRLLTVNASIASSMAAVLHEYTKDGKPFTVSEIADAVLHEMGGEEVEDVVREGLSEAIRKSVLRHHIDKFEGFKIPTHITTQVFSDGIGAQFLRVPVMHAQIRDVEKMVELRRAQVEQDLRALKDLEGFAQKLRERPGATEDSSVGDILAQSVISAATS